MKCYATRWSGRRAANLRIPSRLSPIRRPKRLRITRMQDFSGLPSSPALTPSFAFCYLELALGFDQGRSPRHDRRTPLHARPYTVTAFGARDPRPAGLASPHVGVSDRSGADDGGFDAL